MLVVENLKKNYNGLQALKGISFQVAPGEIYGLLGPNGAGKSTAMNIIAGAIPPSAGRVTIDGCDIATQPELAKAKLGVVPQETLLVEELSGLKNCLFFGSLYGIPKGELRERSLALLNWMGLAERAGDAVAGYSGGMKRRLTMVLGIIHRPPVLLLDEPTVGLDPQTRLLLLDKIAEVAAQGSAVLFSTHYLEEAERLCHRVGIIDGGTILAEGTLEELRSQVEDVQIVTMRGVSDPAPIKEALAGIEQARILLEKEEELVLSVPSNLGSIGVLIEKAAARGDLKEISIKPPSLESLFVSLTGKDIRE